MVRKKIKTVPLWKTQIQIWFCTLFEPSAIANWASAKLDGWSWVRQICQKYIKSRCALSSSTRVLRTFCNLTVARTTRVWILACAHMCVADGQVKRQRSKAGQKISSYETSSMPRVASSGPTNQPRGQIQALTYKYRTQIQTWFYSET